MFLLEQLLPAVALAGAVAALLSALALRCENARFSRAAAVFLPAVAYAAGHFFVTGWTSFPPADTTNWLPYFGLAAAAIVSSACPLPSKTARLAIFGLLCAGAMRLLLAPKFRYAWSAEEGWLQVVGLCALVLLARVGFTLTKRRAPHPIESPLLMVFLPAGTAVALMLSGSLLLGHFGFILSAAHVGALLLFRRSEAFAGEAAAVFSLLHVSLLACGIFFSDLPATSAILLALSPHLASLLERIVGSFVGKTPVPRRAGALRLSAVAALVGVALFVALRSSPPWI
ncbi:MAG: hypothetical protein GXX91_10770 [Verrucomicrobiaceae bacterium]|nr:hypothetical protein [Verrucomicrobiaceae bacterium]